MKIHSTTLSIITPTRQISFDRNIRIVKEHRVRVRYTYTVELCKALRNWIRVRKATCRNAGSCRLKTNSRTAKMRIILYLYCEYIKTLIQKFREAENGFPKAFFACFVTHPSTIPYANTLLCIVVMHFWCSVYGVLAVCMPVGADDDFDRTGQNQWLTCVFHRLTACRQWLCLHAEAPEL